MFAGELVEFVRIKQAGAGSLGGRRRVDDDQVVLLAGAREKTATVVDHDSSARVGQVRSGVRVIKRESFFYARHQLDGRGFEVPTQSGPEAGSHAEANYQSR